MSGIPNTPTLPCSACDGMGEVEHYPRAGRSEGIRLPCLDCDETGERPNEDYDAARDDNGNLRRKAA